MAIDLSTAGVKFGYAVESTNGTRPTTFTRIAGAKSIPELNPAPETLETTTLDATEYKTYIDGLKDLGGALGFTFNLTNDFMTAWEGLVTAADTAKEANKATWFVITIPGISKSLYFTGNPSSLGMPGMEVNSVVEITAYITPTGEPKWDTAYTFAD